MSIVTEIAEVTSVFGGEAVLLPDAGVLGVQVVHRGRAIVVRHAPDHPWSRRGCFSIRRRGMRTTTFTPVSRWRACVGRAPMSGRRRTTCSSLLVARFVF